MLLNINQNNVQKLKNGQLVKTSVEYLSQSDPTNCEQKD